MESSKKKNKQNNNTTRFACQVVSKTLEKQFANTIQLAIYIFTATYGTYTMVYIQLCIYIIINENRVISQSQSHSSKNGWSHLAGCLAVLSSLCQLVSTSVVRAQIAISWLAAACQALPAELASRYHSQPIKVLLYRQTASLQ